MKNQISKKSIFALLSTVAVLGSVTVQATNYDYDDDDFYYHNMGFGGESQDISFIPTPSETNEIITNAPKQIGDSVVSKIEEYVPGGSYLTGATKKFSGFFGYGSLTEMVVDTASKPFKIKKDECPDTYTGYVKELAIQNANSFVGFFPGITKDDAKVVKKIFSILKKYDHEKDTLEDIIERELINKIPSGSKIGGMTAKQLVDRLVPGGEYITTATGFLAKKTTGKDTLTEAVLANMGGIFDYDFKDFFYAQYGN